MELNRKFYIFKQKLLFSSKKSIIIGQKKSYFFKRKYYNYRESFIFFKRKPYFFIRKYYDKKWKYYDIKQLILIFSKQSNKGPNGFLSVRLHGFQCWKFTCWVKCQAAVSALVSADFHSKESITLYIFFWCQGPDKYICKDSGQMFKWLITGIAWIFSCAMLLGASGTTSRLVNA